MLTFTCTYVMKLMSKNRTAKRPHAAMGGGTLFMGRNLSFSPQTLVLLCSNLRGEETPLSQTELLCYPLSKQCFSADPTEASVLQTTNPATILHICSRGPQPPQIYRNYLWNYRFIGESVCVCASVCICMYICIYI